jgi:phytoene synthase
MNHSISEAYRYCKNLTHQCGPHFSVGFRFLPKEKREAVYAVYAFCRYADDIVDEAQQEPIDILLKRWEEELDACYAQKPTHPITIALAAAIQHYPIPKEGFLGLIEGCRMDLRLNRYATFEELMVYCDCVAATIRDLTLPVFGCRDSRGMEYGGALSTALQLTNIVRDVGEDLDRGRIYLPLDEINEAGYSEAELLDRVKNEAFLKLMDYQCQRIRGYFDQAAKLIPLIEKDARRALSLMRDVYVVLIDQIEASPYDVLDRQIRLSWSERARVVISALLKGK